MVKFTNIFLLSFILVGALGFNIPGVPVDFTQDDDVISAISDDIANRFTREYLDFLRTGIESTMLKQLSLRLGRSHSTKDIFTTDMIELDSMDQFFVCTTCRAIVKVFGQTFRSEDGELNGADAEENAKRIYMDVCTRLRMQTEHVCSGLFDLNWSILQYIIMNTNADSRTICGTLPITFCRVKQPEYNWSLTIDNSTGPLTEGKSKVPQKTSNDLTIVHLTDLHYDPEYEPGSLAECDEPLCCRSTSSTGGSAEPNAGYWSDYRGCDAPRHMIENSLDSVKEMHKKIDYIYQTGDIVPHNVWSTTKEGNKAMLSEIHDLIADKFQGIQVFPTVGNHEPHPTNIFGHDSIPDEFQVNWLYEHLWNVWQRWLPPETKETILKGAYYTVSPQPGFRIIALNNNDCYIYNWWLYYEGNATSHPRLEWLHDTLLAAEKNGEYVHILAHIPIGSSDCWPVWAREFNRLLERFSNTISGVFGGHTHKDEMNLHYSQNGYPMGIYWNAGSLTPYANKNPNYRSYEVEPLTYQVVDHSTFIFNLTEANVKGDQTSPIWYKEYQFTEFTQDLSPSGIDKLLENMTKNPDILLKYWEYKVTSADPKLAVGCNEKCLMNTICSLATSVYGESKRCKELQDQLKETLTNGPTEIPPETTTKKGDGAASLTAPFSMILIFFYGINSFLH